MQVKPFTFDSASSTLDLSMTCNSNETDDPPETTGVFFQYSTTVEQWHGLSAYETFTGKGLRYLYLQYFCNFLNLYLELDLDLDFIFKIFLVINISDLFDC